MKRFPRNLLSIAALGAIAACVSVDAQSRGSRELRINGSVGYTQFLRVGHWLAAELIKDEPPPRVWLDYHLTAKMFRDSLHELGEGRAEISLVNGRSVGGMALRGRGFFDKPVKGLRAIAALPHYDWMFFAVDPSLGVKSFADLRAAKTPLKVATGFMDGDNTVGFLALELLRRHGIDPEQMKRAGGAFLGGGPSDNRRDVETGKANAVAQEGARGEEWETLANNQRLVFLSIEPAVARSLKEDLDIDTLEVPARYYYPGQTEPFVGIDFSDWLICVREDMSEKQAYRLAQIVIEQRKNLDREYESQKPRYSSVNVPLDPKKLVDTDPVPLHPGAARYYREKGLR